MKAYAGIGSRETPNHILQLMRSAADSLAALGWTLRSGNAPGADQAFALGHLATGCGDTIELYLPWASFEKDAISGWTNNIIRLSEPHRDAFAIAARFHPAWDSLTQGARRLHARNVHQILGPNPNAPNLSRFVICWTKDGKGGGGTGQALRIARHFDIPIFDLAIDSHRKRVESLVQ